MTPFPKQSTAVSGRILSAAVVIACLFVCRNVAAGPWVHRAGHGYTHVEYLQYFDRGFVGTDEGGLDYRSRAVAFYGEIGLGWETQLIARVPFVRAWNRDAVDNSFIHRSAGTMTLALDRTVDARVPLTFGVQVDVPLYRSPDDYDDAEGLDADLLPAFIDRFPTIDEPTVTITPKVQMGFSGRRLPAWLQASFGPQIRTNDYGSGLAIEGGGGVFVFKRILALTTWLSGRFVFDDRGKDTKEHIYSEGGLWLTGLRFAPRMNFSARAGRVLWARNAGRGASVTATVGYSF